MGRFRSYVGDGGAVSLGTIPHRLAIYWSLRAGSSLPYDSLSRFSTTAYDLKSGLNLNFTKYYTDKKSIIKIC